MRTAPNTRSSGQVEDNETPTAANEDSQANTSPTSPYSLRQTRHLSWKMADQEISSTTTDTPQQQPEEMSPAKASSPKPEKKPKQLLSPTINLPRDIPLSDASGHLLSPKSEQATVKITVQSPPENLLRKSLRSFRLSQSSSDEQQSTEAVSSSSKCKPVESESDSVVSPVVEYCSRLRSRSVKSPSISPVSQPNAKQTVTGKGTLATVTAEEPVTIITAKEPVAVTTEEPVAVVTAKEPITMVTTKEPVAMVNAEEPVTIVTTKEPVSVVTAEEPVTIVTTVTTVATDKPVTSVTSKKLVTMVTSEEPAVMISSKKPVAMVTSEKSVTMATSEKPVSMATSEKLVATVTSEKAIDITNEAVKDEPTSSCGNNKATVTDEASLNKSKEEEEVEVIIVEAAEQLTSPSPSEPVVMITIDDQECNTAEEGAGQPVIVESFDDEQVVTNDLSTTPALPAGDENMCAPAVLKKEEVDQQKIRKRLRSHSSSDGSDHSVKKTKPTAQDDVNIDNGVNESVSERSVTILYSLLLY